jgi:hypothetical protein
MLYWLGYYISMKHLFIIFGFLFLLSYQTNANSLIGKSIMCKDRNNVTTLYANFKSDKNWSMFYFSDYAISSKEFTYKVNLNTITLFGEFSIYYINRKDLSYNEGTYKSIVGYCQVYNSREELIEIMNNEIEQSKSQNKL